MLQDEPSTLATWRSQSVGALAAALAKAQGRMTNAAKDSINPHFKSRYADLASIWSACREALSANEIAIVQLPAVDGSTVTVTTVLLHSSDEWMLAEISAAAANATPQSIGSALTYLRRYGLAAMVGVAPDDDDADTAQPKTMAPPPPAQAKPTNAVSNEALSNIQAIAAEIKADIPKALQFLKVERLEDLSQDQAEKLLRQLEAKRPAAKEAPAAMGLDQWACTKESGTRALAMNVLSVCQEAMNVLGVSEEKIKDEIAQLFPQREIKSRKNLTVAEANDVIAHFRQFIDSKKAKAA